MALPLRVGILTLLLAALAAPLATADAQMTVQRATGTGHIVVAWHGDPARGCAAVGVCDVTGVTTLSVDDADSSSSARGRLPELVLGVGGTARVVRGALQDPIGTCVDVAGSGRVELLPSRRPGGRVRYRARTDIAVRGRCAGPRSGDLAGALPTVDVPARALRGSTTVRLDGVRPFAAGPYSGTVTSAVAIRLQTTQEPEPLAEDEAVDDGTRDSPPPPPPPPSASARPQSQARLNLQLVLERLDGTLTRTFSGATGCAPLDACGLTGTDTLAVRSAKAPLQFYATGPASALRTRDVAGALAAVARGDLRLGVEASDASPFVRFTRTTARSGVPGSCGEAEDELPLQDIRFEAMTRTRFRVTLSPATVPPGAAGRCPGPGTVGDTYMSEELAVGTVSAAQLATGRTTFTLDPAPRLPGGPFAFASSGEVTVVLRRASARLTFLRGGGGA